MIDSIVRVGINNNFNCTDDEYSQVRGFKFVKPNAHFFINSNIKTENILNINNYDYQAVITVNPDITVDRALIERLYKVDKDRVIFVRVKYIPNDRTIKELIRELSEKGYTVVVTVMRFLSNKSVNAFSKKDYYNYKFTWLRLKERYFHLLEKFVNTMDNVYICDRNGVGCQGCGLCSKLSTGKELEIYGLNLSTSGICPFNCVDCYAKKMQYVLKCFHKSPMNYDVVKKNMKQKGSTAHIKHNQLNNS